MASPDIIDENQLRLDLSRKALWYGLVCGQRTEGGVVKGRFLEGRVDFLLKVGGFTEARQLIKDFPLGGESLPEGRTFYCPTHIVSEALDNLFGKGRSIIRVVNARTALDNPDMALVVLPCNSQRWQKLTAQTAPSDY